MLCKTKLYDSKFSTHKVTKKNSFSSFSFDSINQAIIREEIPITQSENTKNKRKVNEKTNKEEIKPGNLINNDRTKE